MAGWFDNMGRARGDDDDDDDSDLEPPDLRPVIQPVRVDRCLKPGTNLETDVEGQPIGFIGEIHIPVFRDRAAHPYHIEYTNADAAFPTGVLVIGTMIDIVACAVSIAWSAEDREWLRGVKITPNFLPDAQVKAWAEGGS